MTPSTAELHPGEGIVGVHDLTVDHVYLFAHTRRYAVTTLEVLGGDGREKRPPVEA
jgi:hypothetical protein